MKYKIVETDNFDSDYPIEEFVNLPPMSKSDAQRVALHINCAFPNDFPRYWVVAPDDYELRGGFEP